MSDDDIDFLVDLDHRTGRYAVTARRNGQSAWAMHKDPDQAKYKASLRLHYAEDLAAQEKHRDETWEQVKHLPLTQRLAAWEKLLGYKIGSRP